MFLILILTIAVVVFGPAKLPAVGKALGKGLHEFRNALMPEIIDIAPAPDSTHFQKAMSLLDHLEDFRRRLIKATLAILVASLGSYFYAAKLVQFITAPAGKLYYLQPAEALFTYIKVSFFFGFLLALPIVLYQLWAFAIPAFSPRGCSAMGVIVPSSVALFFAGLAFAYFFVLPAGLKFFLGFATDSLQPLLSIGQYLTFVLSFLLPFGFIFELPMFILVFAKLGLVSSASLAAKRKVVLLLSFVSGAIISPTPDMISQTMIAVPIIVLYEISALIVKYILKK
jgi:sec-independent protein translocase protein TatC